MNIEAFIESIPFSSGCEAVAYDPCGLIAINKKAGRASHPNARAHSADKPPMVRAAYNLKDEYYSWDGEDGEHRRLYLINRLDSPTSGVLLASADKDIAQAAKSAFKNREVIKVYYAILRSSPFPQKGTWTDFLVQSREGKGVRSQRATNAPSASRAVCEYVIESVGKGANPLCLVRLMPHTGLTHQLRVQAAMHKVPILGDATYGDFAFNKKMRASTKINRLFLHCLETKLTLKFADKEIYFAAKAPMPESFAQVMSGETNGAHTFKS